MRVGIVGCGVAGQAAAILLADAGHAVTVFERFAEPRPIGAGLLLQPTGLAVLRELGLADAALAQGARVVGLEGRTQRGRRVLDLRYADLHPKAFGLGIRRSALFDLLHGRLLRSPAMLVTGAEIVDVAQGSVVDKQGVSPRPVRSRGHRRRRALGLARATDARRPRAGLSLGLHLDDRARSRRAGHGRPAAPARPRHDRDDGPAAGRAGADDDVLEPARRGAGARQVDRPFRLAPRRERRRGPRPPRSSTTPPQPATSRARPTATSPCRAGTTARCCSSATPPTAPARSWARAPISAFWTPTRCSARWRESADLAAALALFAKQRSSTVRFYRQASHLLTPFFQSRLAPLGWLRDAFMGLACHLPGLRPLMGSTLAGTRRGWLSSSPLDGEGRYPLSAPAWRSGPASGRSGPRSDA